MKNERVHEKNRVHAFLSEIKIFVILFDESVVSYMDTSVDFLVNSQTVEVIIWNAVREINEILKFIIVGFGYGYRIRKSAENSKPFSADIMCFKEV